MKKNRVIYSAFAILLLIITISISLLKKDAALNIQLTDFFKKFPENSGLGDTIKINQLNKKAFDLRLSDPQRTLVLAESALNKAKKINYIPGIAEAHRVKGIGYYYMNNNDLAVKNYIEALKYFKQENDIKNEARIYNNFGNLYKIIDADKALQYFKKSLALSKNLKNEELTAGLYFNIAVIYQKKAEYRLALFYFDKSNETFIKRNDTTYMLMYLQNTGILYKRLGDFETAEIRLTEVISKAKKQNLYRILAGSSLALSEIYMQMGNFHAVDTIIKEGIHYSRILKDPKLEYDFIHTAFQLETKRKNYQKALIYLSQVYKYDSLRLDKNISDNIDKTSTHYLQQQQIQENELLIARQKYRETFYWWVITIIISTVLLALVIGLTIYFFVQKKRKEKELRIQSTITLLEQKALQAMMNPHFVFNVMNSIQYFINMNESHAANQILTGFARLMRKHLEICLNSSISLQEEILYLKLYLSLEKIRFSEKMKYVITVDDNIDADELIIPSMLIQPFIENAIWHGIMPKEEGGTIKLDFKYLNNELEIKISDNGIGITNSKKNKPSGHISRGLELIHERVSLLNKLNKRNIHISQVQTGNSGTEVLITIPVE